MTKLIRHIKDAGFDMSIAYHYECEFNNLANLIQEELYRGLTAKVEELAKLRYAEPDFSIKNLIAQSEAAYEKAARIVLEMYD